jgi:hypothetical protein
MSPMSALKHGAWTALVVCLFPNIAFAHKRELGFTLEPTLALQQALGQNRTTLAAAAGPGLGLEYHFLNDFAVTLRGAYVHALNLSEIDGATVTRRTGTYEFRQNGGFVMAGVRAETPSHLFPFSFFGSLQAGAFSTEQRDRKLRDPDGRDFGLGLTTLRTTMAMFAVSGGISYRVLSQVRIQAEPAFYVFAGPKVLVGFGLTLGVTILVFT